MQVVKKREKYRKGTVLSGLAYDKPRPCIEYGYDNENKVTYEFKL